MAWHALYDQTTGQLLSIGDVVAPSLPANVVVKDYAARPDQGMMWDAAVKDFVAIPTVTPVDRWNDLLTNPNYAGFATFYNGLTPQRQTQLQNFILKLLGGRRFRNPAEPIEVDPPVAAGA